MTFIEKKKKFLYMPLIMSVLLIYDNTSSYPKIDQLFTKLEIQLTTESKYYVPLKN